MKKLLFIFCLITNISFAQEELGWNPTSSLWKTQGSGKESLKFMTALNIFTQTEVNDGNIALLDRLWILATDIQSDALISIINPTSTQITEVSSPAWTMNVGYTGNGSSSYLNTNYNAYSQGVNYTLNNASYGIYVSAGTAANNNVEMGINSGVVPFPQSQLYSDYTGGTMYASVNSDGGASEISSAVATPVGLNYAYRTVNTTSGIGKNGASLATGSSSSDDILSLNWFVFAYNFNGTPLNFSNRTIGMAFIGSGNINQLKFYNAFITFLSAI